MMSSEEVIKPMLRSLVGFKVHRLKRWERIGHLKTEPQKDERGDLSSAGSPCTLDAVHQKADTAAGAGRSWNMPRLTSKEKKCCDAQKRS